MYSLQCHSFIAISSKRATEGATSVMAARRDKHPNKSGKAPKNPPIDKSARLKRFLGLSQPEPPGPATVLNNDGRHLIDEDNRFQFALAMAGALFAFFGAQLFYPAIVEPSTVSGVGKYGMAILAAVTTGCALATLASALFTYFASDRRAVVREFHEVLGRRVGYALIIATFIGIRSVVFAVNKQHESVDLVDIVARITAVITVVAIATCVWHASKMLWLCAEEYGREAAFGVVALNLVYGGVYGFHVFRMIASGRSWG
jgi:hypothetical protein